MSAGIDHNVHAPARRARTYALPALIAAVMVACGGATTPTATSGPPTTTTTLAVTPSVPASTTPTTPVASTVASNPTTIAGPGAACPTVPLPSGASNQTTAPGSFDGDGQPDVLRAYQVSGAWRLRVELSAGGQVEVAVPNVGTGDAVKAVGGFNIDENLIDEAFATVGSGSYATHVGVWKGGGFCSIVRVTVNGQPSTFPVGASVGNRSGLRCVGGTALQALETLANSAGTQYTGTIANYDVVGNTLVLANTSPPQVLASTDPALAAYGKLTCGSLTLP